MEFVAFVVDVADEVLCRFVDQGEAADDVLDHPGGVVDLTAQRVDALLSFLLGGNAEFAGGVAEQGAAVGAEDVAGQEVVELGDDGVFANPEAPGGGMSFGDVALFRCTHVVGVAAAGLAVHASAAGAAEQIGAQQIAAFGLGVLDVGVAGTSGAEAVSADVLGAQPVLQRNEMFMDRLCGPDPFLDGVGAVAAGLASLSVPHHVPGVFGVGQQVAHVGVGPAADGAFRVNGNGRRVGGQVEVKTVRDRLIADALIDSPRIRLAYGRCLRWIDVEKGLLQAPFARLAETGYGTCRAR
ncbi:hypothetical protein QMK34_33675 [Amycolatopsis sp. H20-H5]|nr:hypothetical protein [Amycolatopsis sp. H20-H5]MEC3980213.1 hypothetical protein [Amycolatopsis sp. H20-H5]